MLTEYVMKTEELLELSRGTIRFLIQQEPIRFTDMGGSGVMISPEVTLYLKYSALSLADDPLRIISMKIKIGTVNRLAEDYKDKLGVIREEAPIEILEYLDEDGFVKDTVGTPGHSQRLIVEGGFE